MDGRDLTSVGFARRQCCSIERTNDGARDEAKGDGAQGDESNGGYVLLHKDDDDANDDAT